MHNNYHFLNRFASDLNTRLVGKTLVASFSQLKDELVLGFLSDNDSAYLKIAISSNFAITTVVDEFHQAKKNVKQVFHELIGLEVAEVKQFTYERAFVILFKKSKFRLVFKLFGNRSNVILFREETPISIFRKNTAADLELIYDDLDRSLDLSFDYYSQLEGQLTKFLPTLGKQVATYLKKQEFEKLSLKEQYQNLMALLDFLNGAHLFVNLEQGVPQLSFFEGDTVLWEGNSTFEALKKLEFYWFNVVVFTQQKKLLIKVEEKKLKKLKRDLKKLDVKLNELNHGQNKKELADIIMANLHNFDRTKVKTTLFDFYNNIDIEVEIKRGMTPQDFAGRLYKKSKNQHLELSHTQTAIEFKEKEVVKAEGTVAMINGLTSWKELRKCQPSKLQKQKVIVAPSFKEFDFAGYRIYVGRNSKNNDELTLKFAKKDDLWLHAKDVPGSHVVIKKKSGQNVPKDVIEYAAILAGKFSKRKTDSLCPVTVTPKKYVRKMKGAPAGSVIVEREEVVLVKLN